jgi:hypothetical protein
MTGISGIGTAKEALDEVGVQEDPGIDALQTGVGGVFISRALASKTCSSSPLLLRPC